MALQQALIGRAAAIVGGVERLARRIGVQARLLERWQEGQSRVPDSILLQLVDIVLKDDVARARTDRRRHARTLALPDGRFAPSLVD